MAAANIEALIEPERFDRITAAGVGRDRVAKRGKDGLRRGDRGKKPTLHYALSRLAICDRCGERMFASTSPYKRKDGTKRRSYVCANYKYSTELCDQRPIDAEKIDTAVIAYLDRLFVDFDAWLSQITDARSERSRSLEAELSRAEDEAEGLRRAEGRTQRRYMKLMEKGDEKKASAIEGALDRAQDDRDALERRILPERRAGAR